MQEAEQDAEQRVHRRLLGGDRPVRGQPRPVAVAAVGVDPVDDAPSPARAPAFSAWAASSPSRQPRRPSRSKATPNAAPFARCIARPGGRPQPSRRGEPAEQPHVAEVPGPEQPLRRPLGERPARRRSRAGERRTHPPLHRTLPLWQYLRSVADAPGTRGTRATLAMRGLLMAGVLAFPYPFWAIATRGGGLEARQSSGAIQVTGALFLATFVVLAGWARAGGARPVLRAARLAGPSREGALTAIAVGMGAVLLVGWIWFLVGRRVGLRPRAGDQRDDRRRVLGWSTCRWRCSAARPGGARWSPGLRRWWPPRRRRFALRVAVLGGTHGCT